MLLCYQLYKASFQKRTRKWYRYMNILRRLIFYANFLQANYSNFLIVWIYHTAKWVSSEKYMFCEPSIHWNICFNFKTALVWAKKVEKKCKEFDLFIFYFDIRWRWTTIIVKLALFFIIQSQLCCSDSKLYPTARIRCRR